MKHQKQIYKQIVITKETGDIQGSNRGKQQYPVSSNGRGGEEEATEKKKGEEKERALLSLGVGYSSSPSADKK